VADFGEGTPVTASIRLTRRLGAGGMGSVWIARHAALGADVVVKFLADRLAEDPTSRARFSNEASAAARVRSPHVVQMLDHGVTEEGHPFIVMELLDGHDLGRVLKRVGRMAPLEVAHVVEHVALALKKAHSQGIVHRDIKPSNVFLCDVGGAQPFVKLVDFGIAAGDWGQLTTTGHAIGTPSYMSPEQLGGESVDFRADLWSLGVVAFRALTGSVPFERPSITELMGAILHAPMPKLTALVPELPPALDSWFLRACARDPKSRFLSATDMAEALWAAVGAPKPLSSSPSHSQPLVSPSGQEPGPTEVLTDGTLRSQVQDSGGASVRRRRSIVVGAAAGGFVFCGALVVAWLAISPGERPPEAERALPALGATLAQAAGRAVPSVAPSASVAPAPALVESAVPSAKKPPATSRSTAPPKPRVDDVSDLGF
jgi:serine/threonine-protein kinase